MRMRNLKKVLAAVAASVALDPSIVRAQSVCLGGDIPIIGATAATEVAEVGQTASVEGSLTAQELLERQRILSAMKVLTKQQGASTDQSMMMTQKATEASASSYVAQRQALSVLDVRQRYASIGYDPCGAVTKSKAFYQSVQSAAQKQSAIQSGVTFRPGQYGDPAQWTKVALNGSNFDANALFGGDQQKAQEYINFIIGPAERRNTTIEGTAEGQIFTLGKNNRDSYKSVVVTTLSSIAADYAPGGPVEQAKNLSKHWVGDDGGMQWAAATTDNSERGLLQDAVRIEAANLAVMAQQIKSGRRSELVAASLLLAKVNASADTQAASSGRNGPSEPKGAVRKASVEGEAR